jgi:hypothetical protein
MTLLILDVNYWPCILEIIFLLHIMKFKYISKNYKDAEIPRKTNSISAAIIVWKYLGLYLEYKVNQ